MALGETLGIAPSEARAGFPQLMEVRGDHRASTKVQLARELATSRREV